MASLSDVSEPIPALTPESFDRLKQTVEHTLLRLIRQNKHTRYLREAPVFKDFRTVLDAAEDEIEDESLVEAFRATIPLTGYDSYEPFISRMVIPNPREEDVKDMFSPGLPNFIASSSATSSKKAKLYAKYRHASGSSLRDVDQQANPVSHRGGKNCVVYSLLYKDVIQVVNDEQTVIGQFPITPMSSGSIRMQNGMDVHLDPQMIKETAPRATSPVAVSFIPNYRSFLLAHALFALADPQLETISTLFGTVFVDMMRYVEEEWDLLVDSIASGVIPHWEGVDHLRQYLEPKFLARPERAAHLLAIGKATDEPGWLKKLWPDLSVVVAIASGAFAVIIPKMRHYLGPDVCITSLGFTASEAFVGTVYRPTDVNLFKATCDDVIEYLDMSKPQVASSLAFAHEVEVGHRYEIVVTTRDGLWRYRFGDVAEIVGFDPNDGSPILRYVERRGNFVRLAGALVSEDALSNAISSAQGILGRITEFTVIVDDEKAPDFLTFFVEIDGALAPSAHEALARIETELRLADENVVKVMDCGRLAPPTVHVLKPGTFREYRELKIKATVTGAGQVKVPVVLQDPEIRQWVRERVERVIGHH